MFTIANTYFIKQSTSKTQNSEIITQQKYPDIDNIDKFTMDIYFLFYSMQNIISLQQLTNIKLFIWTI